MEARQKPVIFSDKGAWHAYRWAPEGFLHCILLTDGTTHPLTANKPIILRETSDDCLVATVSDGQKITVRYLDARTTEITVPTGVSLMTDSAPLRLIRETPSLYLHVFDEGPPCRGFDLSGLPRTLRWNWRAPLGDIRHGGIFPSPYGYRGFWAWDSWKHAAVLPVNLARHQIQAMMDHQRSDGMIPDTVMRDAKDNNWKCSKPPLAAWACAQHSGLLQEFREPLLRYQRWWERCRRPPGERLFAYGGDDLVASKWESGWDNATRYDAVTLRDGLQNVLSVDLNAYLCLTKRLLGIPDTELESLVDETFYHDGAYYDVTWPDHAPVRTLTAASWIPLWCGIASPERAESVLRLLLDPAHFNTPLPFPTVARSDPKFDPDGYWRGPVWMDHAVWAVEVLARYGYRLEAKDAALRLLATDPDWECYNPLTGRPAAGSRPALPQFSWTAAARVTLKRLLESME